MPVLKLYSGYGPSVKPLVAYLGAEGRAIAKSFHRCQERDVFGEPVWRQMDETRHAVADGRDARRRRSYEHVVISPDPVDEVLPTTMLGLVDTWVGRNLGEFQVAAYVHDDNERHLVHAHLVLNGVNLGRRGADGRVGLALSSVLGRLHQLDHDLQHSAAELGLHAFFEGVSVDAGTWLARQDACGKAQRTSYRTRQATRLTAADRELESLGLSWKADIRDRITLAVALAQDEEGFLKACAALGLKVAETVRGRYEGEFTYGLATRADLRVTGSSLGSDWSREGVRRRIALRAREEVTDPALARQVTDALVRLQDTVAPHVIGSTADRVVTCADLADMLAAFRAWDVCALQDLTAPPEAAGADGRLQAASELALALGCLPELRATPRRRRVSTAVWTHETGAASHWCPTGSERAREAELSRGEAR